MQNTTHAKLRHRFILMLLSLFLGFSVSAQDVLLTQSFENGGAMPSGWAKATVSGSDALSFAITSQFPSGFTAYDGSYMVRFNSYSYGSGTVNRLYTTAPFSTVGKANISVEFAWLESIAYSTPPYDRVTVQYSTDGTNWNDGSTINRYGPADAWTVKTDVLPVGAENQPNVYLAFLFTSQYGNDCYLDDVTVSGTSTGPPPVTLTIGAGTTASSYPYYSLYEDARTQIIYDAAEILAAGGLPGDITSIAFNVITPNAITLNGFNINMQNYSGSTLSAFVETGWTTVYSGTDAITASGWKTYSLTTPFEWDGISNLLVNVCFDNAGWSGNSTVNSTAATGKTWARRDDGYAGCVFTGGALQANRPNTQMVIEPNPILPTGIVQGFTTNAYGVPVGGVNVYATGDNGNFETISEPNGAYIINDISIGTYTMVAVKDGYNPQTVNGVVIYQTTTTYQNFSLTQPSMAITPNPYSVTLNPNEMLDGAFNIANNGNGPLEWTAEIVYTEPTSAQAIDPNLPQVAFSSLPQTEISSIGPGNGQALSSRDLMSCPDGSKFSLPPVGSNNGYTSTTGAGYKCYQQFLGATGSFKTLTFWAIFTAAPPATMNFNIEVCAPGGTPGAVIASLANVPIVPVATGVPVIGYPTYVFTVEIPSQNIPDGWISVQCTTASPTFYWLNSMSGVGVAYQNSTLLPEKLAMCLSGGAGGWLTLGADMGTVNAFTNYSLPAYFNAEGTEAGEVYTADVIFTSNPNVGTVTVPVTMVIAGPALAMPDDLTAVLTNAITGSVGLSWTFAPTDAFLHFVVKRDGVTLGTTTSNSFTDILPTYGVYNYTVQAIYDEGASAPAGPVELEWPNPTIMVDPTYIYDEVWVNQQAVQTVTINNIGEGTLAFSFPEWVEEDGTHAPLAYCTASGGCDEYISNVAFGTINNSSGCSQYADYTSISTDLEIGEVYPMTITNPVPYSSDIAAVYIDWNHNELFTDAGETFAMTTGGGGSTFTGNIIPPETAMSGPTRMRVRMQYGGTLSSCGSTSYGEVEDYTVDVGMPGFIVSVVPAEGTVPQGESKTITITWDATDFDPGMSYFEDLVVESNDLANPSVTIQNEMYVYVPAQFEGTVTDITTGEPLNGVIVTANPLGEYETYILDDGTYEQGFAYTSGTGSIGNLFQNSDVGYITSVDAYFYSGAAMSIPIYVEIYDMAHTLLGVSAPITITDAGWYTFDLPDIEYSGNFYAMMHWPEMAGSTRYMGFDQNGPNSTANLSYEFWDGVWYSMDLDWGYPGVFLLRPTAFVEGATDMVVYDPIDNGKPTVDHIFSVINMNGNSGRHGVSQNTSSSRELATFQTMTDDNGDYSLYVDPGVYNVSFEKTGYETYIEYDTTALAGVVTPLDAQLREESYPPSFVYAEVNDTDTEVLVTWGDGSGPYEVIYDDGTAENYASWAVPGNMNAVKFTPANYPATVMGGRIYVGDGSYPNNTTGFIGTKFGAMVVDDDGANGLPGTTIDSIEVTVGNYGWVSFTGLNAEITDGSFYLVMVQGTISPNCAPVGVDQENPIVYRSYSRNVTAGLGWGLAPYQDFMMRAIIYGSPTPTDEIVADNSSIVRPAMKQRGLLSQSPAMSAAGGAEGNGIYKVALDILDNTRSVTGYRVVRYGGFDPNGSPTTGTITNLSNNVQGNEYTDAAWAGLPGGWYAYGVAARYPDNNVSDTIISNIVGHHIDAEVTINVSLTTGGSPAGAFVTMTGNDYPYEVYTATVPESGQVIFPEVWFGNYALLAAKVGFDDYEMNVNITSDRTIDIILAERKYKPRNLYVDPLTLVATWDEPLAIAVMEDFEGATFPPAGWQALTLNTNGWYGTTNGSSSSFTIPAHTKYAVTNDDADNGDGCCDYLITPEMDWTGLPSFRLNFASFYTGAYSQSAYVEISTDAGATWTVINTLAPATTWVDLEIDLAAYSGPSGLGSVWLAFHADDNGAWASGWAIDDVQLASGGVPLQGYGVFLDGSLVGNTPERTFTYTNLNYGQTYLAGVAALYSSGYSELDTYLFRSVYLIPPTDLAGVNPSETDYVHLTWVAPTVPTVVRGPHADIPSAAAESDQNAEPRNIAPSRVIWDVLYNFDMDGPAGLTGLAGAESDGEFIYAPVWSGNTITKFDVDGNFIENFVIPGVSGLRDLAFDGTYMYGAAAATTVWKMDFIAKTLVSSFTAPTAVRAIAYDTDQDAFWANNWDTDMILFDETGAQLDALSGMPSLYGVAYDNFTADGPYLWFFTGTTSGGGCQVEQYSLPNEALTGVAHSVSGDFGSGYIAGGLYISAGIVPGKIVLGGTAQGTPDLAFGYEIGEGGPGPGPGVANLMGYNIYRDDAMLAYVAKPALEYFDLDLEPATYSYHITAVYDLTPYGYAGQTGESMIEGPIEVEVIYGYELPFVENFTTGLFETNQWSVDGANWHIAGQAGNPAPSAEFTYTPIQNDYALSLTSFWMNGTGFIDGKIYLDFDLKLDDNTATGEEQLLVEVYNGSAWVPYATYTAEGDMAWEMKHVDITNGAKNKVFRVRFTAKGVNTLDINNWQVDNVHIYRVCEPPTDLEASLPLPLTHGDQILLEWVAPESTGPGPSAWLFWDNGVNNDAIGLTGGGTFNVAVRFTPAQLAEYAGTSLTKIRMFAYGPNGTLVLKVWTGANASQLVLSQPIASYTSGAWNEWTLNTPVMVTGTTELWFGYAVTHGADYVAGCDAGPAVAGYGDMISLDGSVWESMSQAYALNYNWNLQGWVETLDGVSAPLQPINDNTVYGPVSELSRGNYPMLSGASLPAESMNASRELTGYNIYRDEVLIGNTAETSYLDTDPAISVLGQTYCYNVTAVYEDCESEFSNTACETVIAAGDLDLSAVNVYPNPSNSVVNIELTNDISQLVIYNYVGQVVQELVVAKDKNIQIDVRNYDAGAYLIKFITKSGDSFTKKIAVTK